MKKNMGRMDRTIRIVIALAIVLLWYFGVLTGTVAYILLAVVASLVLTSFVSFCPLYTLVGVNTCKREA